MEPRRFFLHGIGGLYNYGCEAIVRGTVMVLRSRWPDTPIIYLSKRPDEDARALADCDVAVWDNSPLPRWNLGRAGQAILRRAQLPHAWVDTERFRGYGPGDFVLSIGGDIFTLGTGPYPKRAEIPAVSTVERMQKKGAKVVLWGASVGPFEAWPQSIPVFTHILNSFDLVTIRESTSLEYLRTLGISQNAILVADPAFLASAKPGSEWMPIRRDRPVLGVNLSPLSARYLYGSANLSLAVDIQARWLRRIVDDLGVSLLLVPHVIAPHDSYDDDYRYLEQIYAILSFEIPESVALLSPGLGAQETKGVLSQCDALIAARMHCGIQAVSAGTPTLFVAYSAKAWGMAEYIYGDHRHTVDLQQLVTDKGVMYVKGIMEKRDEIRKYLTERNASILKDVCNGIDSLQNL